MAFKVKVNASNFSPERRGNSLLKQNKKLLERQVNLRSLPRINTPKEKRTLDDIGKRLQSNHAEIDKISKTTVLDNYRYNPNRKRG